MLGAASTGWSFLSTTTLDSRWSPRSPWDIPPANDNDYDLTPSRDLVVVDAPTRDLVSTLGPAADSGETHRTALGIAIRIGFAAAGALTVVGTAAPAMAAPAPETSISTTRTDESRDAASPTNTAAGTAKTTTTARTAPPTHAGAVASKKLPPMPANPNRFQVDQEINRISAQYNLPPDLLKAIAWQESGWQQYARGDVMRNENRSRDGRLLSTDWGIVQVNDRAHPEAFPRAKTDVRYSLTYAARLLNSLYSETHDWDRAVERYNGINSDYVKAIDHHRQVQPWTVYVVRDHLNMTRTERRRVEARLVDARKGAAWADHLVGANQKKVDAFGVGVHEDSLPASVRKNLQAARHRLETRQREAVSAHTRVDDLTRQAADLDAQIQDLTTRLQAEKTRLVDVRRQEIEAKRKAAEEQRRKAAEAAAEAHKQAAARSHRGHAALARPVHRTAKTTGR